MTIKLKSNQSGMTLIELLIVIGLGSLIIVGALLLFGSASDKQKVLNETRNLSSTVAAVSTIYASQPDYNGINESTLIASGGLPANMYSGTGIADWALISPWGDVDVASVAADADRSYTITYKGIPDELCVSFVSSTLSGFEKVEIGASVVTTPTEVAAACTGSADIIYTAR